VNPKRAAIFEATLDVISERGLHDAPMSLIAERADVGAGTIYRHFANKDDLIVRLYREIKREMAEVILGDYDETAPIRERFRALWINTLRYCLDHPKRTAYVEQFANSPMCRAEIEGALAEHFAPALCFFQYAVEQGVAKPMPFEMASAYTVGMAIVLAKMHLSGALALSDELIELAVDASWDAIKR